MSEKFKLQPDALSQEDHALAMLEGFAMKSVARGFEICPRCGEQRRLRGCYRGECYAPRNPDVRIAP